MEAIGVALQERLLTKTKQNSRLLQCLPVFSTVPQVRALVADHLERWLQSPALSGAARNLFSTVVGHMRSDPPLPEDLEATNSILSMQLKANQLNVHIENITKIAKNMPTASIARHIFLTLLRKELNGDSAAVASSDHMRMVAAVHGALAPELSAEGLAMALLTLLAKTNDGDDNAGASSDTKENGQLARQQESSGDEIKSRRLQRERNQLVRKIRMLIRRLSVTLGSSFDACRLIDCLLSFGVQDTESWTIRDEEDKGRILLECMTLLVPDKKPETIPRGKNMRKHLVHSNSMDSTSNMDKDEVEALRKKLSTARVMLIEWCCNDYAPLYQRTQEMEASAKSKQEQQRQPRNWRRKQEEQVVLGAGEPCFSSILDGKRDRQSMCPKTMRSVLFMAEPESIQKFLCAGESVRTGNDDQLQRHHPAGASTDNDDELYRLQQCYHYGADLTDGMVWKILRSAASQNGIGTDLGLKLIENLFACCNKERKASLRLSDPQIVWEMYKLVEYTPPKLPALSSNDDETNKSGMTPTNQAGQETNQAVVSNDDGRQFDDAEEDKDGDIRMKESDTTDPPGMAASNTTSPNGIQPHKPSIPTYVQWSCIV